MTIDMPKPVSNAYIKSDNAAPNPVTKPDHRPLFNVRCIHNIPIGPIGADTNMPMAKPRIIVYSVKSIKSKNYLILSSNRIKDPNSKSYRRFPLSDFELSVNTNEKLVEFLEHENDCLIFQHKTKKTIRLNVSLDLREMLYYIQQGFNPSINDLKGKFIELQVFKNLLEAETYTEILVTNDDKNYFRISLDKGTMHLSVAPLNNE